MLPLTTRSRFGKKFPLLPWLLSILFFFLFSLTGDYELEASHYRFGAVSWERVAPNSNTVRFTIRQAWRRSWSSWNGVNPGGTANTGTFYFGDGSSSIITLNVTSVSVAEDWMYGEVTILHTYSSNGPFVAYYSSCCRIGTLQNNANGSFRGETTVDLSKNHLGSAVSSIAPIINLGAGNPTASFQVPGVDPDGGAVTYSAAIATQVGGGVNPVGLTVSPTGLVTFNTVGLIVGRLYNVRVRIVDSQGAYTNVDFIVRIVTPSNAPFFNYLFTPANNSVIQAKPGDNVNFNLRGEDLDVNDSLNITVVGKPLAATLTPIVGSNPRNATFDWTPGALDLGTYVMNFTVEDPGGLQAQTSVTIIVSNKPVFDFPPTPSPGGVHVMVAPGSNWSGTVQASDPEAGDKVTIDSTKWHHMYMGWNSGLPPNMSWSAPLPSTPGNPTSLGLSFSPTAAQWGHNHVMVYISDTLDLINQHEIKFMVNTMPGISTGPIPCVTPGSNFSHQLISSDPDTAYGDSVYFILMPGAPAWVTLTNEPGGNGRAMLSGTVPNGFIGPANIMVMVEDKHHIHGPGHTPTTYTLSVCGGGGPRIGQHGPYQCSPDSVIDFSQSTTKGGFAVDANRSVANRATGTPENNDTYNFASLGYGGSITLAFTQGALYDSLGPDFTVVETSFKSPTCRRYPEKAQVEVALDTSQGGSGWFLLPDIACLDHTYDFSSTGLSAIKFIRITDVSNNFGGMKMDYYDVDGILCGVQGAGAGNLYVEPKSTSNELFVEDDFIQAYPNPANQGGVLNLYAEALEMDEVKITIYNSMGQRMYETIKETYISESISLSAFVPGMYIVHFDVDGVVSTRKLIVR